MRVAARDVGCSDCHRLNLWHKHHPEPVWAFWQLVGSQSQSLDSNAVKYHNKPCEVDGEKYRSQREMRRHQELRLLERAGQITDLRREVPFPLAPAAKILGRMRPALRYFADFTYYESGKAQMTIEDCKGVRTTAYNIKRHLMKSIHGLDILET
jgi:hypothetical protein